jgi:hypothetical protein
VEQSPLAGKRRFPAEVRRSRPGCDSGFSDAVLIGIGADTLAAGVGMIVWSVVGGPKKALVLDDSDLLI